MTESLKHPNQVSWAFWFWVVCYKEGKEQRKGKRRQTERGQNSYNPFCSQKYLLLGNNKARISHPRNTESATAFKEVLLQKRSITEWFCSELPCPVLKQLFRGLKTKQNKIHVPLSPLPHPLTLSRECKIPWRYKVKGCCFSKQFDGPLSFPAIPHLET